MEDHRDVFGHHFLGQREDHAVAQLHIQYRKVGLVLLVGQHGGRYRLERTVHVVTGFGHGFAQVETDDAFILGDQYRRLFHSYSPT